MLRFELKISWSQAKRDTRLRYTPFVFILYIIQQIIQQVNSNKMEPRMGLEPTNIHRERVRTLANSSTEALKRIKTDSGIP